MIAGSSRLLRINGKAALFSDHPMKNRFEGEKKIPQKGRIGGRSPRNLLRAGVEGVRFDVADLEFDAQARGEQAIGEVKR